MSKDKIIKNAADSAGDIVKETLEELIKEYEVEINELKEIIIKLSNNKKKFTIICNSCGGTNVRMVWDMKNDYHFLACDDCGNDNKGVVR